MKADSGLPLSRAALRLIAFGAGARDRTTDVSGRFEFRDLPPHVSTNDLQIGPGVSAGLALAAAPVRADGTFEVRALSGTRAVRVFGLPQGWALKTVLYVAS